MNAPVLAAPNSDWDVVRATYAPAARAALERSIVPFWQRAVDSEHGGVFSCWNNAGTQLVSRDKFVWSQGRFVWLWSRLADLAASGMLSFDAGALLEQARAAAGFLLKHAFLPDGRCAYLLSETGAVKEAFPGAGPAPSIYADCFVAMGLAEFGRVSRESAALDAACALVQSIEKRIAAGEGATHPAPVPSGYDPYALAMICLNIALVMNEACATTGHPWTSEARQKTYAAAQRIFDHFLLPGGRMVELRPTEPGREDSLLARHANPGHALEGLWMLIAVAREFSRDDWLARAHEGVRWAFERGWDEAHSGLLHFVDCGGGEPRGSAGPSEYEEKVRAAWDVKLWWVHSEAIYAALASFAATGNAVARRNFERVWAYAFRTFPQPDIAFGEWIQIRDRVGRPVDRVVALPVKDPYHIARNLIQVLELFSRSKTAGTLCSGSAGARKIRSTRPRA